MKFIFKFILLFPLFTYAQDKGIVFKERGTWQEIVEQASRENKYIFVDAYATWCKPCKQMDKEVYPADSVGDFMNSRFVSVKIQLDSAKSDNDFIKLLYPTAREFESKYKISSIPTFLFFSPDGKLVYKSISSKTISEFVNMASNAITPEKQVYKKVEKIFEKTLPYNEFPELIKYLKSIRDLDLAKEAAKIYMHEYLDKLSEKEFLDTASIQFILDNNSIVTTKDRIFLFLSSNPSLFDDLTKRKGTARQFRKMVVYNEELLPIFLESSKNNSELSWRKIKRSISSKYDKNIAEDIIWSGKMKWYGIRKEWEKFIPPLVKQMKRNGYSNSGWIQLTNNVEIVFDYSKKRKYVKVAVAWADAAIAENNNGDNGKKSACLNAKAILLYRLGDIKNAITLEEEAALTSPKISFYQKQLDKMKSGSLIWKLKTKQY